MKHQPGILLVLCLLAAAVSPAQCPPGNQLWNRLVQLSTPSALTPAQELEEYSKYTAYGDCMADSTHAYLLQRIGAAHYKQGDFIHAIDSTRRSVSLLMRAGAWQPVYQKMLVKDYYNLSVFYDSLNMTRDKMRAIDSCINISVKANLTDEAFLYTLHNRTQFLLNIGDFDRCYDYAGNGERFSRQLANGERAAQYLIYFLNIRIAVLLVRKEYEAARQLLNRAIGEFEKSGSNVSTTALYENLAEVLVQKGDYAGARSLFEKTLAQHSKAKDNLGYIQTLNNMALYLYFRRLHDTAQALALYRKAIGSLGPQPGAEESGEAINILANMANLFAGKGQYDSAFHYFSLAFSRIKPGIDEKGLLDISISSFIDEKNWPYLTPLVIDKGDAYLQQYKRSRQPAALQQALYTYRIGVRLFERMMLEHSATGSKLFWQEDSRRLYEHAIEACAAKGDWAEAFYFFEKSRAVLLSHELSELQQLGQGDILLQTQLKKQILRMRAQLNATDPNTAGYAALKQELFAAELNQDKLLQTIKARNPLYFQSFLDTTFVTLGEAKRRLLQTHQAVVEMFAGDSAVYLLALLPDTSFLKKIDKQQYDTAVERYTRLLSDPTRLNRQAGSFYQVSHGLYKLLFDGIPLPAGRIIVSPDGPYFPLEALISKGDQPAGYLVKQCAFSYTYSARYLLSGYGSQAVRGRGDFLGMAPVQYGKRTGLAALSGSELALDQVQPYFHDPRLYLLQAATRSQFLQDYARYKIVQLYTHAIDKGSRGEPEIFFCDSSVHLSELLPEAIPVTRLMVLSACETAKGKLYKGEGVFNFNRAFAALGIPASVTNLWQADSKATYRLTNLLYRYIAEGQPLDLALQQAKQEFIATGSGGEALPYYWAGTVLAGRTEAIALQGSFPWWGWLLLVGMAAGMLWQGRMWAGAVWGKA